MDDLKRLAQRERVTVGEWVRRTLREACIRRPVHDSATKLKALRRSAEHAFPTADIEQMLSEIERGYQG